jgi:hypothetical protein
MAQTVECLLCNHEALSSNPTTIKKKEGRKGGKREREGKGRKGKPGELWRGQGQRGTRSQRTR